MITPINLFFITRLTEEKDFTMYEKRVSHRHNSIKYRAHEHESLIVLVNELFSIGARIEEFDSFYYSYAIPQIEKEFDLLKMSTEYVLNIELKSQPISVEKMQLQLVKNKHYLSHIRRTIIAFTFISSTKQVYVLDDNDVLRECDLRHLLHVLKQVSGRYSFDIDSLFCASKFLVSPLNTPEKFLANQYFLTDQQETFKQDIMSATGSLTSHAFFKITGQAGTGKTLLLYDIAKECSAYGKCCIIHSGVLSDGHNYLHDYMNNCVIISAKSAQSGFDFDSFKYIFVDEAHRLRNGAFQAIVQAVSCSDKICIWSLDQKQTLSESENSRNIAKQIDKLSPLKNYKLTTKIRTNHEMAQFIHSLFNLHSCTQPLSSTNIDLVFACNNDEAHRYLNYYQSAGYTYISYTPSQYYIDSLNAFSSDLSVHAVIGQEFDNIVMLLDSHFAYDENMELRAIPHPNPDYLYRNMLFQGLSRVREKIAIIVLQNIDLYRKIATILN